ncbi:MAG: hypothetical protein MUC43_11135, partial [Pirellula sp.]|nr:hypothetical protein [Pirellula sp.]
GLPRTKEKSQTGSKKQPQPSGDESQSLIAARSLIVHEKARQWLSDECGIQLVTSTKYSRNERDYAAESLGKVHGASHEIKPAKGPLGIGHKRT